MAHVHVRHVQEQHNGQRNLESEFIGRFAEFPGQKAQPSQNSTRHHNQKDGQRGIQAENQIFHTKFPPVSKNRPCTALSFYGIMKLPVLQLPGRAGQFLCMYRQKIHHMP